MLFTWDPRKAASNLSKHGVAFDEAVTVFADPFAIIATTPSTQSALSSLAYP